MRRAKPLIIAAIALLIVFYVAATLLFDITSETECDPSCAGSSSARTSLTGDARD